MYKKKFRINLAFQKLETRNSKLETRNSKLKNVESINFAIIFKLNKLFNHSKINYHVHSIRRYRPQFPGRNK